MGVFRTNGTKSRKTSHMFGKIVTCLFQDSYKDVFILYTALFKLNFLIFLTTVFLSTCKK